MRPESAPIGYGKAPTDLASNTGGYGKALTEAIPPGSTGGGYGKVAGSERVILPWAKVETEDPGR